VKRLSLLLVGVVVLSAALTGCGAHSTSRFAGVETRGVGNVNSIVGTEGTASGTIDIQLPTK
jgi:predicted small secreted protein